MDPDQAPEQRTPTPGAVLPGRGWLLVWILGLAALLLWLGRGTFGAAQELPYSAFKQHLARGEVLELTLGESEIRGRLRTGALEGDRPADGETGVDEPQPDGGEVADEPAADEPSDAQPAAETADPGVAFRSVRVDDPGLVAALEQAGVPFRGRLESPLGSLLLLWLLPLAAVLVILVWLVRSGARSAGGQAMGFGKSKARLVAEEGTGVRFDDVAGCDEAKRELAQMVEFLRSPERYTRLGGRIPKGVLLLGPPGTGKTLLARAVAGEAGVPFFSITGSDFVEMFVGVGAARVRDLFVQATTRAPCIVFVDEIDAIGRQRGVSMGVVNDEREQTLNQLLAEMDGFENNSGVILLAATNRPEILDKALIRPGRFDRQVVLDAPDLAGRRAILAVHARGKPLADDVDLERVARVTPGMCGADLANAMNEAALLAADRRHDVLTQQDLEDAVEKVVAGPELRSRRLDPAEKRRVACHEAGHALVAWHVPGSDPVQKISIVPRGRAALGYTLQLPDQEHFLRTRGELTARLSVLLGGRTAEELTLGDVSTGAEDDLRVATDIARQMVCIFGMSERVGLPHCARPGEGLYLRGEAGLVRDCSEQTSLVVDEEVRELLTTAREEARAILRAERDVLERLTAELLERETLDRTAFADLVRAAEAERGAAGNGHATVTSPA
jgi:cell division protease FtsH